MTPPIWNRILLLLSRSSKNCRWSNLSTLKPLLQSDPPLTGPRWNLDGTLFYPTGTASMILCLMYMFASWTRSLSDMWQIAFFYSLKVCESSCLFGAIIKEFELWSLLRFAWSVPMSVPPVTWTAFRVRVDFLRFYWGNLVDFRRSAASPRLSLLVWPFC